MIGKTWIFDPEKHRWLPGPELKHRRYNHGCFSVKDESQNITEIYVTGGYCPGCGERLASTEVLRINGSEENWHWSDVQDLPHEIMNFNAAIGSREGVYLGYNVGGNGVNGIEDTIYGLRKTNQGLQWDEVRKINSPSYYHSVVNAPSSYIVPFC